MFWAVFVLNESKNGEGNLSQDWLNKPRFGNRNCAPRRTEGPERGTFLSTKMGLFERILGYIGLILVKFIS